MGEIYLIRHGQASFGEKNYDRLSDMGIAQSRRLGEWIKETSLAFDAVYSGERERQQDTALLALAAAGQSPVDLRIEPAFNELDADRLLQYAIPRMILREPEIGPLLLDIKGHRDTFRHLFERIVDEWIAGTWDQAGIGNWRDFSTRVLDALTTLAARHGTGRRLAVFTSGGPITATMQGLGNAPGRGLDWQIANTSITRLAYDARGALTLVERRVIPHLADRPELLTHL